MATHKTESEALITHSTIKLKTSKLLTKPICKFFEYYHNFIQVALFFSTVVDSELSVLAVNIKKSKRWQPKARRRRRGRNANITITVTTTGTTTTTTKYLKTNHGSTVLIKKTRWRINSRWRVVLKFVSLQYNFCSFETILKNEYIVENP
jgi:hypothetical protein